MNFSALAAFFAIFLAGCNASHERVSDDVKLLRNLVEIDLSVHAARWEVFNTPEYIGGIPGPADYITLIAEIEPADSERFQSKPRGGIVWVAPEAARSWLVEDFRKVISKYRNGDMDLSVEKNCRKLQGTLRKAAKPIHGFVCNSVGKSLIYLTLLDNAVP